MPQQLPLYTELDASTAFSSTYRTLVTSYSDGYSARMPDGINNKVWSASIVYSNKSSTQVTTVLNALDAIGGWDYFTYDPVDRTGQSNPLKWRVKDGYKLVYTEAGYANVTFEMEQIY
jgi:phage-related protein